MNFLRIRLIIPLPRRRLILFFVHNTQVQ